jgi:hypothetical protein
MCFPFHPDATFDDMLILKTVSRKVYCNSRDGLILCSFEDDDLQTAHVDMDLKVSY